MAHRNATKKLLLQIVCDLSKSKNEVWFTRAAIAWELKKQNLGKTSTLNPSRKGALQGLAADGLLIEEPVPGDTRGTWHYKLANPDAC